MKPKSSLTLRSPPEVDESRKKHSTSLSLDSVSPDIRKSVEQCMADLSTGYRSTVQGKDLRSISISRRNKEKSSNSLSARRRRDRNAYLEFKRHSDGLPNTHVFHPSSPSVEIEEEAFGAASSLESLQSLVIQRKEYLEMSQTRKRKVMWYERVTRQSKQLLEFLRANDRSAGDSVDNFGTPKLVPRSVVSPDSSPETQLAALQQDLSTSSAASARTEPFSSQTAEENSNVIWNGSDQIGIGNKRSRYGLRTNGHKKSKMETSSDQGCVMRLEDSGKPTNSSAHRLVAKIQDARLEISGNTIADNETGAVKRKMISGDDKENEDLRGRLAVCQPGRLRSAASAGVKRVAQSNWASGRPNGSNPSNNPRNGEGLTRRIPGVQTLSQTWAMKRKRANGPSASNNKHEGMDWIPEAETFGTEAMAYSKEATDPSTEATVPRDESLWATLKNMWKKQKTSVGVAENASGPPPLEEDVAKGGTLTGKTSPRARVGRSIKRRRRDVKPWVTNDDDADDVPDVLICGPRPGRLFVIPDRPYDVDEALSADLMNAAYDFIHNG